MDTIHFKELLEQYITGTIKRSDEQKFLALLERNRYRKILEQVLEEDWKGGRYEEATNAGIGKLIEQYVVGRINEPEGSGGRVVRSIRRYWWIAASVLPLLMAGVYLLNQSKPETSTVSVNSIPAIPADVAPGGDRAMLTLADGTTIVLDSASNGTLARQGNSNIIKRSNGQLVYQSAGGKNPEMLLNTMSTPRGGQYELVLPDGSKVWLNAASSITYPVSFTGKERKVTITGEAFFEVVKNGSSPFVVISGKQELRVLGTQFNINTYSDEKDILSTLLEGSIKITYGHSEVMLIPGQQSAVENGLDAIRINTPNIQDVVAWKNGFFSFRHADIKSLMRQLSRWYDVEIRYDAEPSDLEFTGKIDRKLTLAQVLKILEQTRVHFRIEEGKKLVILP